MKCKNCGAPRNGSPIKCEWCDAPFEPMSPHMRLAPRSETFDEVAVSIRETFNEMLLRHGFVATR